MYAEINAAVQASKALFEVVKANKGLVNYNEIVAAVSEVNTKLMDATAIALASQEKQSQLARRITELEKEFVELKNWNSEAERYQLTEIGTSVFAFILKPGMENSEPKHRLCTACFSKRQKGYLHFVRKDGLGSHYKCDTCGHEICSFCREYLADIKQLRGEAWSPFD